MSKLRRLLNQIENDSFASNLSNNELNILCAASEIKKIYNEVESSALKSHDLVIKMKPATFHRALKSLVQKKFLEHFDGAKAKRYRITDLTKV